MSFSRLLSFIIFHAATKIMLEEREIVTDTYSITFLFKLRTVAPTKFIFQYKCRYLSLEEHYKAQEKIITESVNYLRILNLYPGSQCEINLETVYHPGSLDPGLSYIVNTYLARQFHNHIYTNGHYMHVTVCTTHSFT